MSEKSPQPTRAAPRKHNKQLGTAAAVVGITAARLANVDTINEFWNGKTCALGPDFGNTAPW